MFGPVQTWAESQHEKVALYKWSDREGLFKEAIRVSSYACHHAARCPTDSAQLGALCEHSRINVKRTFQTWDQHIIRQETNGGLMV